MTGLPIELELTIRLLAAGIVGGVVGLEREVHGHPAGLRTQILVAVGSAVFTILSFQGFAGLPGGASVDPTRIAAQVVSGIGFLGAGAILKDGMTIRGLTTAASLWGTAALGMAAAVGAYWLAGAGAAIILASLWALRPVADRLEGTRAAAVATVRLEAASLEAVGRAREALEGAGLELATVRTRRQGSAYAAEVVLRNVPTARLYAALAVVAALEGVTVGVIEQGD